MRGLIVCSLFTGVGCGSSDESCDTSELAPGEIQGSVDGAPWVGSGASFNWAGTGFQITTEDADGYRLTLAAQTTIDGVDLATAGDGEFPLTVDLSGGGFGLLYPSGESSYSSDSGTLIVTELSQVVRGCFDFQATAADGDAVTVTQGLVHAAE